MWPSPAVFGDKRTSNLQRCVFDTREKSAYRDLSGGCLGSLGCEISALTASFSQTRFEAALELLPALLFGFRAVL
jgi:hypothetical protein